MAPKRKTIRQYEREAKRVHGCLVHPSYGAARKTYKLRHGDLPSHLAVCHSCDNTFCIRDKHHFVGTWRDNVLDSVRKGRHSCFRKGGVRFAGPHSEKSKRRIAETTRLRWKDASYRLKMKKAMAK